jgi:hypothetical protein
MIMGREERFWIAFWSLVAATTCVVAVCITVSSVSESRVEEKATLSRIEHGCKEPPNQPSGSWDATYLHEEEMARIEHGCLAPESKAQ